MGWGYRMQIAATRRLTVLTLVFGLLCAFGSPGTAIAADAELKTRVADLATAIKEHKKAKDVGQLKADLDVAVKLHADAEDCKSTRKKVIALMSSVTKGNDDTSLTRHMITTMGATKDPDASKVIKGYLKQKNPKKSSDVLLTAIKVAGTSPHPNYVEPLLKLFEKSKHMGVSARALDSLGAFHDVKNKRCKIVKVVIETVRKYKPGVKGNEKGFLPGEEARITGEGARSRWETLAPIVPKMLGRLTGNEMYGAKIDDWFTMYDENKRDLQSLFVDDE